MRYPLNAENLSHLLGVELEVMERQLGQISEELEPYLHVGESGKPELALEGLPVLIKRMAFNIPTTDIIENLICQVLHVVAMHEDFAALEKECETLREQNARLNEQVMTLQKENRRLREQIEAYLHRSFGQRLADLFRHS